jgi:hypothetical protein
MHKAVADLNPAAAFSLRAGWPSAGKSGNLAKWS